MVRPPYLPGEHLAANHRIYPLPLSHWRLLLGGQTALSVSARGRRLLTLTVAMITLILATAFFVRLLDQAPPNQEVRTSILLPEKSRVLSLAVSPNGRDIALVLVREGKQEIWIRALDVPEPAPLAGTEGASDPFWSPDSRSIRVFRRRQTEKDRRSGGPGKNPLRRIGRQRRIMEREWRHSPGRPGQSSASVRFGWRTGGPASFRRYRALSCLFAGRTALSDHTG